MSRFAISTHEEWVVMDQYYDHSGVVKVFGTFASSAAAQAAGDKLKSTGLLANDVEVVPYLAILELPDE